MNYRSAGSPSAFGNASSQAQSEPKLSGLLRAIRRVFATGAAVSLAVFGGFCGSVQAQTLTSGWNQLSPATIPQQRYGSALAYDAGHTQVVMFGGFGYSSEINDTWLWDGTNWTQVSPANSPSARFAHSMVYDAAQGRVVLFGGSNGSSRLGDTWLWDGTNWTQANPPSSPSPRDDFAMTYDAAHGQIVLFGGSNGSALGDTWIWNGSTWTQLTPSATPSARSGAMMAYDAVMGEVILFGGLDTFGSENNDTWAWNGLTWTNISPSSGNPPARDTGGMEYDAASGQVVLFGGESAINGPLLNDTWVWNGSTWTQQTPASVPGARESNSMAYDAAQSQIVMFGGYNAGFSHDSDTWTWSTAQSFGNINVCPYGGPTPAPCSNTLSLTYTFAATTNLGGIQVLTQGAPTIDFAQANGNTCTGTIQAGASCSLNITFAPTAPGLRLGAVNLFDNGVPANLLVSTPIYGNGQAPVASFSPIGTYVLGTSEIPVSAPKGVAVDAAGDVFIASTGNSSVAEVLANSAGFRTVGTGFVSPEGLAVDGAGNLFVADPGLNTPTGEVVEVPFGCTTAACQVVVYNPAPHPSPVAVAVDGIGNLYVADNPAGIVKIPPGCYVTSSSSTCQSTVGTGLLHPTGVAVDALGNIFVSDSGLQQIVEIPAGCTTASCQVTLGTGWNQPQSVALDAAGDVIVADAGLNEVIEVPAGCINAACQITLASSSFITLGAGFQPFDAKVDPRGNLYIADYGLNRVDNYPQGLEAFNFSETLVNNVSGDSPKSVLFQNIGNQALSAISPGLQFTDPDFTQVPGGKPQPDCTANFSLIPGSACNLSVQFDPLTAGEHGGYATFSDNSLNNPSLSQSFPLNGQGDAVTSYQLNVSDTGSGSGAVTSGDGAINCSEANGNLSGSCTASYSSGTVTLTATPSAGSVFSGWSGGTCSGTSPTCVVTMNSVVNVTATFNQQNFGSVNVCSSGSPAPCSSSYAVTFNFAAAATVASIQVVTQGATGLDFQQGSGSTCTATSYSAGSSCTVSVNFTPHAPGLRMGAVNLLDGSGNVLATQLVSGIGQGAAVAFSPATQITVPTSGVNVPSGVAVDAAGNVFISTQANQVVKVTPGGVQTTVPATGLNYPYDIAVDGAGDVFLADFGNNRVVEVTPGGVQTTVPATGLNGPTGVAVDGAGDVFIADSYNNRVVKVTPSGVQTTLPTTGVNGPFWPAVDAAGDVFFLDDGNERVVKVTPAGIQSTVPASGLVAINGVAVDAAGDVFISDQNLNEVVEVTASGVQTTLPTTGLNLAAGVAVDGSGDVFIADHSNNRVVEVVRSQPPTLSFGTVTVGARSADIAVSIQNIGNQLLTGTVAPASNSNFAEDQVNSTCGNGSPFSIAPGGSCVQSIYAQPQAGGPVSATATMSDNSLNGNPATQAITLSAAGLPATYTLTMTGGGSGNGTVTSVPAGINCTITGGATSGTCSGVFTNGNLVTLTATALGGSSFQGWGGLCSTAGTNQVCSTNISTQSGLAGVSASFGSLTTYPVSVTLVGSSGTVISSVGGISCSVSNGTDFGTCAANYSPGTPMTLTATPNGNSIFAGWGGDCASSGASATCNLTTNSALNPTASFVAPGPAQVGTLVPITAGVVYGQGGSFTSGTANNGGLSAGTLHDPDGLAFDSSGDLYLADQLNARVLFFPAGSTTPTRIYGQNGNFNGGPANAGGLSANSLNYPQGVALDSSGNLYVADTYNNRVLLYPAGSTTATRVYGQGGSFTSGTLNNGGISANSLDQPAGVALDSSGNLYVADQYNSRVLFYPAGSTTATRVYGQSGSFTSGAGNNGGISANSLAFPSGIALDSSGNLYVADNINNRVLFYPFGSTTATRVYGQNGSFTRDTANNGGISANGLSAPEGVTVDTGGNVYVADYFNNRVLFYPFGSTTATRVYGQGGSVTTNTANENGISANSLNGSYGVALDPSGNLYVQDLGNNRVVEYGPFGNVNVCPTGQSIPAPCSRTYAMSYYAATQTNFGATQVVTQGASGLDFSLSAGNTCIGAVSAGDICTANVTFTPLAPGLRTGAISLYDNNANPIAATPVSGIGAAPLAAFSPGTQLPVNTGTTLNYPNGLLTDDAGNLFIADGDNQRVLKVAPNGNVTTLATGLTLPQGMAEDGAGNLFIADNSNQVVKIPTGCTTSACQTLVPNTLGLQSELGVAVDPTGNLFVGDFLDGKVAMVPANGGPQTIVYNPTGCGNTTGCSDPVDLTTDAAGNLFIADYGLQTVAEVPPGCTTNACVKHIGTGWSQPDDVAVDAAGDVFVADQGLKEIVEVPVGCTTAACQVVLVNNVTTVAVKVDAAGDLFFDNLTTTPNQVFEITRSLPPSLSFALTNSGTSSADSPQTVSVQNVGNQPLTGSLIVSSLGSNFAATGTCDSGFPLSPGASCSEGFSFIPQTTGYFTATASFSDNTLNLSSAIVLQPVNMTGIGGLNGQATTTAVPNVVGLTQSAASSTLTGAGLLTGSISTASSNIVPSGSVIASNPTAGTQVALNSSVKLLVSSGPGLPPSPNPLSLLNNYFVTGDYAVGGVTLRGAAVVNNTVTQTININGGTGLNSVPTGADLVDGLLYWATLENSASPSAASATFLGYSVSGQQIGSDLPYTDPVTKQAGTLRVYRADVNTWFQNRADGTRIGSGSFSVTLPSTGTNGVLLTEGASLVVIYRVLSPNFPLKAVVIYDGSATPTTSTAQSMQGFYDALGGANSTGQVTPIYSDSTGWNSTPSAQTLGSASQYSAQLNPGAAYGAVILSTPVNNPDNDGILGAWKTGPQASTDFHQGEPGYYDVKTGAWVALPGAKAGQKDLFVQLDWMCGAVLTSGPDAGSCDPQQENFFPAPDASGNDPLAMVTQAFAAMNPPIALHLQIGNIVPETTCTDAPGQPLCQFPNQPGVIGWKNSLEISKVWPRNFASCVAGGDCSPRFAYGQKDSYHYVLFGNQLAIPAWNSRYGTLVSINAVAGGTTTITTTDRGTGINACPSRITIAGIQSMPSLNGIYDKPTCPNTATMVIPTPTGVGNWTYTYATNTPAEPVIGITSGTVTSISGYSDLGGADSAVTLGQWETSGQDMSKRANVIAGTLLHEIGHTIGLSHGGLYYNTPGSYVPTFETNCKPNYQSIMNYLFQLDGVGSNGAITFSNQTLATLSGPGWGPTSLVDTVGDAANIPTSSWYVPWVSGQTTASAATLHCDGTPIGSDGQYYRVTGPIAPITPAWQAGQEITYTQDDQSALTLHGFNDVANIDLRQVGATGGEFASLANVLSFGSSFTPINIAPGGSVSVGPGGSVTLGAGGSITVPAGNVTVPSGGNITLGAGGNVTLGAGGNVTLGAGGTVTPGSNGGIGFPSGGNVTLGAGGNITLGAGGSVTLVEGGNVTLGAGGAIMLPGGGGSITIPATGGSYTVPAGGSITLGGGGNITLGGGGNIALGAGGSVTPGAGGNITLGGGGNITLGAGGNITLGGGGNITLGAGGNITLGGGGTISLASGGNVTLGGGGNVTLGAGGNVTLGAGGNVTLGAGGSFTLGAGGGNVTLGAGGNITLGGGGNVTLGAGGEITGGGTITMVAAGNITLGGGGDTINGAPAPAGNYSVAAGGNITLGGGGNVTFGAGGNVTLGAGGTITMNSGGRVTLGGGGNVTFGAGGNVTLGAGGNITLGAGGNITLGGGGNVTLGGGGASTTEMDFGTANSVVRPPTAPTETAIGQSVVVNWNAPVFGVVQTYTIYRQSTYGSGVNATVGPTIEIGSVSGINGSAPATTFIDAHPDTAATTVAYTITTTLVPDQGTHTQRQSVQSPPAVVTYNQTIVLGALQSSYVISQSPTVSVTATISTTAPVTDPVQQVNFTATGTCSIVSGSQTLSNGVSSGSVSLDNTGSCTITASQSGSTNFNPADPVSQSFTILPVGSQLQSQTINFTPLPNVVYGAGALPLVATASLPVTFSVSGPCNNTATNNQVVITGVGRCTVTASASANSTYTAATATQSFNISPAVLTVTAINQQAQYGGPLPSLVPSVLNTNYSLSGFVNKETAAVVSGVPTLSTTATTNSAPGAYPITVATGSLAATNYSFLYVPGTLTIGQATPTITLMSSPNPSTYGTAVTFTATVTSGDTDPVTFLNGSTPIGTVTPSNGTATLMTSSLTTGSYTITASIAAGGNYLRAISNSVKQVVNPATLTVTANNATRTYGAANPTFTAKITGFVNGDPSTVVSGSPSLTTSANATSVPGNYPIVAAQGTLSAANYIFAFVNGTLTVTATGSVPSSGTACNGAYTGTFKGNITVSKGQNCVFVSGGTTGSITGTGGNIILQSAAVGSGITIQSGGTFSIGPSTTINGSVTVQSLPKGTTTSQICGSTITGSVVIESDGVPILIGSGTPSCAGNIIKSSLQVASNSGTVTMYGNSVTGSIQVQSNPGATTIDANTVGVSLQDQSNTGGTQVFNNIITNALQCSSNTSITGGSNKAAVKQGQCAKF